MSDARAPLLVAQSLAKRFGGLVALDGLDITVHGQDILGLIGPNGSGKTTFFNVVTGIYAASAGAVLFQGKDITHLSPQAIYRAGITRTFQRSRLCLELSIFDNIMIGNHKCLHQSVWFNVVCRGAFRKEYVANVEQARHLLHVFDSSLAERMFEPVGGLPMIDRRRIEICRAVISQPTLLLLDEPSAGMTHDETMQLMDDILTVKERLNDLTIIMIEHEMGVIERITSTCAVLNFGRKICQGTYQDVTADTQVQQAYLGMQ